MKKVLLATTMLAGTAGFASAEVAISGYAEIGIWDNGVTDVQFWHDLDVTFTMTGTTDGGLEFGATVDLDEAGNLGSSTHDNGGEVWVSGAFGKLTMGDTDGALDWALADMDGGMTSIADDHSTYTAWFGGSDMDGNGAHDNQVVRYENTFGNVGFAISLEQNDNGLVVGALDPTIGVGVKYTADMGGTDVALGLGYQQTEDAGGKFSAVGVSAAAQMAGGFGGKIGYIKFNDSNWDSHLGLEVSYKSGPIGVAVNYGKIDYTAGGDVDGWGAVANYDLGGGAVAMFGYGDDEDAGGVRTWSLGLGLSF
ncbi:porin [Rhodobacter sp. SGA-6-6]|uniref:porin n=1 Tax=Rhodobacter sp. SGA-6-6 TaxID=2710882 RepID=UPI0013EA1E4B|nr:porin [Rhodobacter sp. SGA-6-6]NGM44196.1 porin [Rhodobacter sp. SGA-6-6]